MKKVAIVLVLAAITAAFLTGCGVNNSKTPDRSYPMVADEKDEVTTEVVPEATSSPRPGDRDGWRVYWIDPETGKGCWVSEEYLEEREFNSRKNCWGDGTPLFDD